MQHAQRAKSVNITKKSSYFCPHCHAQVVEGYFQHLYSEMVVFKGRPQEYQVDFGMSICPKCEIESAWMVARGDDIDNILDLLPMKEESDVLFEWSSPSEMLPRDISRDYIDAMQVYSYSPRASVALIHAVLGRYLRYLGGMGQNFEEDLNFLFEVNMLSNVAYQAAAPYYIDQGNLVEKWLSGDVADNLFDVSGLFRVINLIAVSDPLAAFKEEFLELSFEEEPLPCMI